MAQLKSTSIEGNLIVNGTLTANSIKLTNGQALEDIGKTYWSGGGKNVYCPAGVWTVPNFSITIPKGEYIITITAQPQCYGVSDDWIVLGVDGNTYLENLCNFSLSNNNNNVYYPHCTHTFFCGIESQATLKPRIYTFLNRQVNNVEIAAMRISSN